MDQIVLDVRRVLSPGPYSAHVGLTGSMCRRAQCRAQPFAAKPSGVVVNGRSVPADASLQPVAEGDPRDRGRRPSAPPPEGSGAQADMESPAGGGPGKPASFETSFTHARPTLEAGDGDAIRGPKSPAAAAAAKAVQQTSPFRSAFTAAATTGEQVRRAATALQY